MSLDTAILIQNAVVLKDHLLPSVLFCFDNVIHVLCPFSCGRHVGSFDLSEHVVISFICVIIVSLMKAFPKTATFLSSWSEPLTTCSVPLNPVD